MPTRLNISIIICPQLDTKNFLRPRTLPSKSIIRKRTKQISLGSFDDNWGELLRRNLLQFIHGGKGTIQLEKVNALWWLSTLSEIILIHSLDTCLWLVVLPQKHWFFLIAKTRLCYVALGFLFLTLFRGEDTSFVCRAQLVWDLLVIWVFELFVFNTTIHQLISYALNITSFVLLGAALERLTDRAIWIHSFHFIELLLVLFNLLRLLCLLAHMKLNEVGGALNLIFLFENFRIKFHHLTI